MFAFGEAFLLLKKESAIITDWRLCLAAGQITLRGSER